MTTQGSASSGGMIGYNLGALRMSCNSGALGNSEIGGLVGQCDPGSEISSSLYIGEATRYPIYVSSTDTTLWNVFYLNENHSAWFDPSGNEVDFAAVLIIPETDTWVKTIAFQINDELVYTVYVLAGTSAEEYVPTAENLASVLPEGYELTGWTAEEGSSNLFDFSTPVNGNIVLHAVLNDTRSDEPSDDEGQTTEDAALSDDGVDANPSSDSPASNGEPLPQTGDTPLLYVLSAMCLLSAIACAGSRLLSRKYSR